MAADQAVASDSPRRLIAACSKASVIKAIRRNRQPLWRGLEPDWPIVALPAAAEPPPHGRLGTLGTFAAVKCGQRGRTCPARC
jgi:hypothetical protein